MIAQRSLNDSSMIMIAQRSLKDRSKIDQTYVCDLCLCLCLCFVFVFVFQGGAVEETSEKCYFNLNIYKNKVIDITLFIVGNIPSILQ